MAQKMKIKKGDQVIVITGKDKGKQGEVVKAMPQESRVVVRGVNMVKKHQKPTPTSAGGITSKETSIHISNVALVDPKTNKPTRVGITLLKDGTKARIAKRSGETITSNNG
jgi:large subunit ribosomal protein L24